VVAVGLVEEASEARSDATLAPVVPPLRALQRDATPASEGAGVAILLLDVINDLEWEGGELLLPHFEVASERIAALAARARAASVPVIYVNDNYGRWRSDFRHLVAHCVEDDVRGRRIVKRLLPLPDDYFVLKPKHSGFFSTTLDMLLQHLSVRTLVLTGVAGNICVLFTAGDAHMRDYRLFVPVDCVASNTAVENVHAITLMATVLGADTLPSTELDLDALSGASNPPR